MTGRPKKVWRLHAVEYESMRVPRAEDGPNLEKHTHTQLGIVFPQQRSLGVFSHSQAGPGASSRQVAEHVPALELEQVPKEVLEDVLEAPGFRNLVLEVWGNLQVLELHFGIFKRLTPDSRAPAKQGEGLCLAGSLGGKEKSKKVVADDVSEHKLRNISPT